jgi:hypothetical protein
MRTKFWSEKLKREEYSEVLGVDENITLEWILRKYVQKLWADCMWLRVGTRVRLL